MSVLLAGDDSGWNLVVSLKKLRSRTLGIYYRRRIKVTCWRIRYRASGKGRNQSWLPTFWPEQLGAWQCHHWDVKTWVWVKVYTKSSLFGHVDFEVPFKHMRMSNSHLNIWFWGSGERVGDIMWLLLAWRLNPLFKNTYWMSVMC